MLGCLVSQLMKLKVVALSGTSAGQMLNLLMNDSQKVLDGCTFLGFSKCPSNSTILQSGDEGAHEHFTP